MVRHCLVQPDLAIITEVMRGSTSKINCGVNLWLVGSLEDGCVPEGFSQSFLQPDEKKR